MREEDGDGREAEEDGRTRSLRVSEAIRGLSLSFWRGEPPLSPTSDMNRFKFMNRINQNIELIIKCWQQVGN